MKPTNEQVKKFWGWCGFRVALGKLYWYPDKESSPARRLPPIDLNNLFKYAVPKLEKSVRAITIYPPVIDPPVCDKCYVELTLCNGQIIESFENTPALALFWAIWEVIEGEVINE